MTLDAVRQICRALPGVTEDIKWGHALVFSVGAKMFVVIDVEPPHGLAFKCTPEGFAELVERDGMIPAPYLARAMWVREQELGATLGRRELTALIKQSHALVVDTLPRSRRPGAPPTQPVHGTTRGTTARRSVRGRAAAAVAGPPPKRATLAVSGGFKALVLDHLEPLGSITAKAMFGGVGLYYREIFFGIMASDVLYLKVDDSNRRDYEHRGMAAFKPFAHRPGSLTYHAVPADVVESPMELTRWAKKAVKAATAAATSVPSKR